MNGSNNPLTGAKLKATGGGTINVKAPVTNTNVHHHHHYNSDSKKNKKERARQNIDTCTDALEIKLGKAEEALSQAQLEVSQERAKAKEAEERLADARRRLEVECMASCARACSMHLGCQILLLRGAGAAPCPHVQATS